MNFEDFSKYFAILGGKRKKIFFARSAYKCIPESEFSGAIFFFFFTAGGSGGGVKFFTLFFFFEYFPKSEIISGFAVP